MIAATWLWWHFTPAYNNVVARAAVPFLHLDSRLHDLDIDPQDTSVLLRSPDHLFPAAHVPASQLTYNFILFIALVATERRLFRDRKLFRFVLALVILFASHVLMFIMASEALYATAEGAWSDAHYGSWAQDGWLLASLFLRLVGIFAFAFLCWLLVRGSTSPAESR